MVHWLDKYIEAEKEYYGERVYNLIREVADGLNKYGDGDAFFDEGGD